jgi:hypothetical protein
MVTFTLSKIVLPDGDLLYVKKPGPMGDQSFAVIRHPEQPVWEHGVGRRRT